MSNYRWYEELPTDNPFLEPDREPVFTTRRPLDLGKEVAFQGKTYRVLGINTPQLDFASGFIFAKVED